MAYIWRNGKLLPAKDLRPSGQFLSSTWPWPWPWRSQGCSIQEDFVLLCACFRSQTMWNLTFEIKIEKVKLGRLLTRTCYYELKQTLFNWFRRGRRFSLFCLRLNSCHFAFFARFAADILSYGRAAESHARNLKVMKWNNLRVRLYILFQIHSAFSIQKVNLFTDSL